MKKFTDIKLNNDTAKKRSIQYAMELSGLPESVCTSLYESMKYSVGDSEFTEEEAMEMFNDYFEIDSPVDANIFSKEIVKDIENVGKIDQPKEKRRSFTKRLMSTLKKYLFKNDTPSMLEALCCIMTLKDSKSGIVGLTESLHIGDRLMKSLKEHNVTLSRINSMNIAGTPFDKEEVSDDIEFYTELKTLLNERFKDYGAQPAHIQNIYQTIMDFVATRANDIQTESMIIQSDENSYYDLINKIINHPTLDGMLLSPDYLKTQVSDMQTLLFDLIIIVNTHLKDGQSVRFYDYIDPEKIYEYNNSLSIISRMIASSRYSSFFLRNQSENSYAVRTMTYNSLINNSLTPNHLQRVSIDCLQIMKNLQGEFNLPIRKVMNLYITKASELLYSLKNVKQKMKNNININI